MKNFGNTIRTHRENNGLPLRVVASYLKIDQAILSKIETGKRRAKREQVVRLASLFKTDQKNLLTLWLADKVYDLVKDEEIACSAMHVAEKKYHYYNKGTSIS